MIIERSFPLLKVAVTGTAVAVAAVLVRRLLKKKSKVEVTVTRGEVPARAAVMHEAEVPWGVEV